MFAHSSVFSVEFNHLNKQRIHKMTTNLPKVARAMTAPELLKAEMPLVRQCEANLVGYGYTKGTNEWYKAFNVEIAFYRQFCAAVK